MDAAVARTEHIPTPVKVTTPVELSTEQPVVRASSTLYEICPSPLVVAKLEGVIEARFRAIEVFVGAHETV